LGHNTVATVIIVNIIIVSTFDFIPDSFVTLVNIILTELYFIIKVQVVNIIIFQVITLGQIT